MFDQRIRLLFLSAVVLSGLVVEAAVPNKSGVRPDVLSLPSGPGSIEGLGESFEPNLSTGSSRHSVPLKIPPGRGGAQPTPGLSYESGRGNGVLGLGWSLTSMHVRRQTDKGLPSYGAPGSSEDTFVTESGAELVRIEGTASSTVQTFRLKNENTFARYVFLANDDRWEFTARDGMRYGLGARLDGSDVSARVEHPSVGATYAWHVGEMRDLNGNQVFYQYTRDQQQVYCTEIRYGFLATDGPAHTIELLYESRPDPVVDYRPTFRLETNQRLKRIDVRSSDALVRRYDMDYVAGGPVSLLERVTLIGSDGSSALPPTVFGYSDLEYVSSSPYVAVQGLSGARLLLEDQVPSENRDKVEIIDYDGDALPDFYQSKNQLTPAGEFDVVYKNTGSGNFSRSPIAETDSLALNIQGELSFVRDVDGNGLGDVIAQKGQNPEDMVFRLNVGGQWGAGDTQLTLPTGTTVEQIFSGPDVRAADLNFDKKIDSIRSYGSIGPSGFGLFFSAYMNIGDGTYEPIIQTSDDILRGAPPTFAASNGSMIMADMNGDRLLDLVQIRDETGGDPRYWPSMGMGKFDDSTSGYRIPLTDGPDYGNNSGQIARLEVIDINDDGLSDLARVSGTTLRYWLNEGGVQFGAERTVSFGRDFNPSFATYRFLDIDGDGLLELLFYANFMQTPDFLPVGIGYVRIFGDKSEQADDGADNDGDGFTDEADEGNVVPNLLSQIENGIGLVTSIGYSSSVREMQRDTANGMPWPEPLPIVVQVVSRTDAFDGLRSYATEYLYHDGYYNGIEKEFRGFARVDAKEIGDVTIPDLIREYVFDVGISDEALKGRIREVTSKTDAGGVFYSEANIWQTRTLAAGSGGDLRSITYPFVLQTEKEIIERSAAAPISIRWEYDYDDYGNRTSVLEHGRLDPGWDDERLTVTRYSSDFADGLANWILDRPVEMTVSDENDFQVAARRHYYDGNGVLGSISQANETRVEEWVSDGRWLNSVRRVFDNFGNPIRLRDGLFGSEPGHERVIDYDDIFAIYPVQETVNTGSTSLVYAASYDTGFGVMLTAEDANNHITTFRYDPFSRLTSIVKPGDSLQFPTTEYSYQLRADLSGGRTINWVNTKQREVAGGGTVDARTFIDGRGQTVMTRSEGEVGGQIVVTDATGYNARGLPSIEYLPYFDGGSLAYQDAPPSSPARTTHYDALSRVVRVTNPDASFSTRAYLPLAVEAKDEEQTNPASVHFGAGYRMVEDGLQSSEGAGRVRQVTEIVKIGADGTPITTPVEWLTTYNYDLLDNITGYTDSQNNVKQVDYDGLSRLVFVNDPDRGITNYDYNDASNLMQTVDAKGQVNRYEYDGANRLKREFYDNATPNADVEYFYDAAGGPLDRGEFWSPVNAASIAQMVLTGEFADTSQDLNGDGQIDVADVVFATSSADQVVAENTRGSLSWVRDQSGEEHLSYDERARTTWRVKRITDASGSLRNFYSGMTYDSMDRLTSMTYPDQSELIYNYNDRGLLESVPGIVSDYSYNFDGQVLSHTLGNGIQTNYTYDERLRLRTLASVRNSDGLSLQDLSYALDAVSNITKITDLRDNATLESIGGELGLGTDAARAYSATQDFQYDSLYRLIQAENSSVYGTIGYRYDRIGNMIQKSADLIDPYPTMNLGAISQGGAGGSSNRSGRAAGDPPGPHAVTSAENPLVSDLGYDDNGNVVAEGGRGYTWDTKDRLATFTSADDTAIYSYDHANLRRLKVADGQNASQVLYIGKHCEVRNSELIKYANINGRRLARAGQNQFFVPDAYYLHDHLSSAHLTTSGTGSVSEQAVNFPFGEIRLFERANNSPRLSDYQFTGKERDAESGWRYFGARYLHESQATFVSVDPLDHLTENASNGTFWLNPQNLNRYAYVANRSIVAVDRNGMDTTRPDANNSVKVGGITLEPRSPLVRQVLASSLSEREKNDVLFQLAIQAKSVTTYFSSLSEEDFKVEFSEQVAIFGSVTRARSELRSVLLDTSLEASLGSMMMTGKTIAPEAAKSVPNEMISHGLGKIPGRGGLLGHLYSGFGGIQTMLSIGKTSVTDNLGLTCGSGFGSAFCAVDYGQPNLGWKEPSD